MMFIMLSISDYVFDQNAVASKIARIYDFAHADRLPKLEEMERPNVVGWD